MLPANSLSVVRSSSIKLIGSNSSGLIPKFISLSSLFRSLKSLIFLTIRLLACENVSISLKKNAIISKVNNELWDLNRTIDFDCDLEIITKGNKDLLEVLRHDAAHVMAEAVLELYPDTQITIGPAIDNGFYYDFYKEDNFTPKDLELIEKRMHEIVDRNEEIIREVWTHEKRR